LNFLDKKSKNIQIPNLVKIRLLEAGFFYADIQTWHN